MAMILEHGDVRDLGEGLLQYTVVIDDASDPDGGSELIKAPASNEEIVVVGGYLIPGTAGDFEIKNSDDADPRLALPGLSANQPIYPQEKDELTSGAGKALLIESSVASTIKGILVAYKRRV